MKPVAVFDIDGVLADVRHRLHFVQSRPKRWGDFFAAADADGLLEQGSALAGSMAQTHEIRYLTGRPERIRAVTQSWLGRHSLPAGRLTMRPNRDHRPSRIFKQERVQGWLDCGDEISLVVDDDASVVEMLQGLGVAVLAATWQDIPAEERDVLWQAQELLGRT